MSATADAGIPGRVTIRVLRHAANGRPFEGDVETEGLVFGSLAVTPATRAARDGEGAGTHFADDRWSVTHVPTGRSLVESADPLACRAFAARWGAHEFWARVERTTPRADWPTGIVADLIALGGGGWVE